MRVRMRPNLLRFVKIFMVNFEFKILAREHALSNRLTLARNPRECERAAQQ